MNQPATERKQMIIRRFENGDIPDLLNLCRQMKAESSYEPFDFNKQKMFALLLAAVENDTEYFGYVAEDAFNIVGMMLGICGEFYFGTDKIAEDSFLYVVPEMRGGMAAKRLITQFEHWAIDQGCSQVKLGITTGVNEDRTKRLYESLGFSHSGIILKKEV